MAKTLLDLDPDLLSAVAEVLGTTTKRSTVEVALQFVLDRHLRRQAVDELASMTFLAELADPDFEDRAWA